MGSVDELEGLRHELQRLRAENARLSRLLVTMASPVADKLALFADRFRTRVDVYAVRWENPHRRRRSRPPSSPPRTPHPGRRTHHLRQLWCCRRWSRTVEPAGTCPVPAGPGVTPAAHA